MKINHSFYTKFQELRSTSNDILPVILANYITSLCKDPWFLPDRIPALFCSGSMSYEPAKILLPEGLPCYFLLYTESGNCILNLQDQTCFLSRRSLLFLDGEQRMEFQVTSSEWKIRFFCIRKEEVDYYYQSVAQKKPVLYPLPVSSDILTYMDKLREHIPVRSAAQAISAAKWITNILSELSLSLLSDFRISDPVPEYLQEMKNILDHSFEVPYKLEDFEKRFSIQKTRLCREFSHYYQMPPLQYLNRLRINAAKDLLLSTNMPVYEIGNAVGIENTNHFINLFKKNTGVTPLVFRQSTPDSIRDLHVSSVVIH